MSRHNRQLNTVPLLKISRTICLNIPYVMLRAIIITYRNENRDIAIFHVPFSLTRSPKGYPTTHPSLALLLYLLSCRIGGAMPPHWPSISGNAGVEPCTS